MKQHVVVMQSDELFDSHYRRTGLIAGDMGNGLMYSATQKECAVNHSREQLVYFTDGPYEAEKLAEWLSTKYPGNTYCVGAFTSLFVAKPGPIARAIFTPEGVMPA